jgi:hypothetical protein
MTECEFASPLSHTLGREADHWYPGLGTISNQLNLNHDFNSKIVIFDFDLKSILDGRF